MVFLICFYSLLSKKVSADVFIQALVGRYTFQKYYYVVCQAFKGFFVFTYLAAIFTIYFVPNTPNFFFFFFIISFGFVPKTEDIHFTVVVSP